MIKISHWSVFLSLVLAHAAAFAQPAFPTVDSIKQDVQDAKQQSVDAVQSIKDTVTQALPTGASKTQPVANSRAAPAPVSIPAAEVPKTPAAPVAEAKKAPATPVVPSTAVSTATAIPVATANTKPTTPEALPLPPMGAPLSIPNDPAMLPNPGNIVSTPAMIPPSEPSATNASIPVVPAVIVDAVTGNEKKPADEEAKEHKDSAAKNDSPNHTSFPATKGKPLVDPNKLGLSIKRYSHHKKTTLANANYKHIRLPETIYSRQYDRNNKHLPTAYYENDLNEMLISEARQNNINAVRAMLDYDKRGINTRSTATGETPLIAAVRHNASNVVTLLLGRQADMQIKDVQGFTALDYANQLGLNHIASLIQMRSSFKLSKLTPPNAAH